MFNILAPPPLKSPSQLKFVFASAAEPPKNQKCMIWFIVPHQPLF